MTTRTQRGVIFSLLSVGLAVALVTFTRWRNKQERNRRLKNKKQGTINIGGMLNTKMPFWCLIHIFILFGCQESLEWMLVAH
jgi:hypothetical protein